MQITLSILRGEISRCVCVSCLSEGSEMLLELREELLGVYVVGESLQGLLH